VKFHDTIFFFATLPFSTNYYRSGILISRKTMTKAIFFDKISKPCSPDNSSSTIDRVIKSVCKHYERSRTLRFWQRYDSP